MFGPELLGEFLSLGDDVGEDLGDGLDENRGKG